MTLPSDVVEIVRGTIRGGDNLAEHSSSGTFGNVLQTLRIPGDTCKRIRLLLQNSCEDVKLQVGVEDRRCSHGLTLKALGNGCFQPPR